MCIQEKLWDELSLSPATWVMIMEINSTSIQVDTESTSLRRSSVMQNPCRAVNIMDKGCFCVEEAINGKRRLSSPHLQPERPHHLQQYSVRPGHGIGINVVRH